MYTLTIATIKGGTGKTTTAEAMARAAAADGLKVLLIDLDPQFNLTMQIGADASEGGAKEAMKGEPAADYIQSAGGLDILAGHPDLYTATVKAGSARNLSRALEPLKSKYDLCIIDTAPALGELSFNAVYAADGILIPIEPDPASLAGLGQIVSLAREMQREKPELAIAGTFINKYDGRARINKRMLEISQETAEALGIPFLGVVRHGVAVKAAAALHVGIYEHDPRSNPAQDFLKVWEAVKKGMEGRQ